MEPMPRLLAAALAAVLLAACGKAEEKADETLVEKAIEASSGQHAEVDIADGQQTVTIETEEGTYVATSGDDVRLPDTFPADVRLPEDGRLVTAMSLGEAVSVSQRSPRAAALVFAEFRQAQVAQGWTESAVLEQAPIYVAGFTKDQRRMEANFVAEADGGTTLAVTVQPGAD
ncbi:hypothetical protein N790_03670 [Arenimonas malthae CC-JY-1]|uniref:Lipoprotein n=1 Tax=Arenimonas malthae CC-JY-1 TaxID=1384054 RepID=A0A091BJU8_9GAMM|nr:hypothetical protein [Arenimonas malthae]KFN52041.1 hypothetical protein N790_03670 [Arenimonas malthae CC-JY-1]